MIYSNFYSNGTETLRELPSAQGPGTQPDNRASVAIEFSDYSYADYQISDLRPLRD